MSLPTNYQNEVLNSAMGNRRQYRLIENNNGTYSFVDVTVYDREGSLFDADDVNTINTAINLNASNITTIQTSLQDGVVNGVKGAAETDGYRTGQITLSAADIGTLTEAQIRALISGGSSVNFVVVDALPTQDISTSTIYMIPSSSSRSRNTKDEFIYLVVSDYEDVTSDVEVVEDSESLPAEGSEGIYYITEDDEKIYTWDDTEEEYVESETITSSSVDSLPSEGTANVIYILSTDDSAHMWVTTSSWEQIGSTSVDLTNYYTKTEIDTGALVTTAEFETMMDDSEDEDSGGEEP